MKENYYNTLLGYFDIHGYSNFIKKNSFDNCKNRVISLINSAKCVSKTGIHDVKLDFLVLSDSLLITVDTERCRLFRGSIEILLRTCSAIMADAMKIGLPLRGAIGGGYFFQYNDILISSALVDAAEYEKCQNWLGAVITPTALSLIDEAKCFEREIGRPQISDISSNWLNNCVRYGTIPWKKEIREENPQLFPAETFYIKPNFFAEQDWTQKYLPEYFLKNDKVENSNCLYGEK